jgi:2,3-bisphosphoglycerate-independent phosphoglycerate mutase
MKIVMIIIDGLGDAPISSLGGKTPLEAAHIPHIHYIASRGQTGRIRTTFEGFPIESMVCIMGLLGYEPSQYYPHGRASFEAMAKGIPLNSDDLVLRCNTITADPAQQKITDFTGGLISDSDARKIISKIKPPFKNWELFPGQSYRNIFLIHGEADKVKALKFYEPHMNIGIPLNEILVKAVEEKGRVLARQLNEFLLDTSRQIAGMDLPENCKANMLWLWSPSIKPDWPSFYKRTGLKAAFVGGLDFLHGIAMAADIHFDVIPGATGYINTDYQAKGRYTIQYLKDFDFILTHINATDEEAHQHNHLGKIEAIEAIDRLVVGPVLYELEKKYPNDYRIVICGDHGTRCCDGKHTDDPVPYAMYGKGKQNLISSFTEKQCLKSEPFHSICLLKNLSE